MKTKNFLRVVSLLVLLFSLIPVNQAAFAATSLPPADMFQLPWDQGAAWVAIDGIDNGTKRPTSSSHNFLVGGAVDFAPHNNMVKGEDTSNFWVAAAAGGTVVQISSCHLILDHGNGWLTQYQFLAKIQVKLGDVVSRNQRLGIIADGVRQPFCPGSVEPNVPHVHFMLRPTMIGATFGGWLVKYSSFFNQTTFTRNGLTVGLFKPLLNAPLVPPTPTSTLPATPTIAPTITPGPGTASLTPSVTPVPGTASPTPTSTLPEATATLPESTATFTATPPTSGPYASTVVSQPNIGVGDTTLVTVSLNNVPAEGYTSAEFTCTFDPSIAGTGNIVISGLFGADAASVTNVPQAGKFIVAIAGSQGNKATTSGVAFTFDVAGLQAGQTTIDCTVRVSQGNNTLTDLPSTGSVLDVLAATPIPTLPPPTETIAPAATQTPSATFTPLPTLAPTQTPIPGWLTFTDATFGFQFMYPPQGQIQADSNDSNTRINNLPIVQPGTNLTHKFMDVLVGQNVTECKSQQTQDPGVTVTINGIPFLKQTGAQGAAGSLFQLVEYSTLRDGVCVNLEFVLQSHDPSSFPTPPPVFDYATETALFDQIIGTYMWLALPPTATSTLASTPVNSPTPTPTLAVTDTPTPAFTATMVMSPTPSGGNGAITGQVTAGKPVVVNVYNESAALVATMTANPDGSFRFEVAPGNYTVIASAPGFLRAQAAVMNLNAGVTRILPSITLLAGDIDGNDVIDQFDALTIGMNYDAATPAAADLNNDGTINVLDLELLANNYRDTGPTVWQ